MKRLVCLVLISSIIYGCRGAGKVTGELIEGAARGIGEGIGKSVGEATGELIGKAVVGKEKLPSNLSKQQFLSQIASQINQSMPLMVDRETQLTNVAPQPDGLLYNYILVNYASYEVDSKLIDEIYPKVRNQACSNPDVKVFWQNDISLYYSYSGNDNKFIGRFAVSPSNCGY